MNRILTLTGALAALAFSAATARRPRRPRRAHVAELGFSRKRVPHDPHATPAVIRAPPIWEYDHPDRPRVGRSPAKDSAISSRRTRFALAARPQPLRMTRASPDVSRDDALGDINVSTAPKSAVAVSDMVTS